MQVDIWVDPICPFCWMTSRWLVSVAADRDLEIAWRPISLLVKNGLQPGDDVGTPIIAVDGPDGRVGFFGPVITRMGTHDECLRLWDGFVAMATSPGFFELKRTRTEFPDPTTIR